MQSLSDLTGSGKGVAFLASEDVFLSRQAFVEQLGVPLKSGLTKSGKHAGEKLVCSGQQVYVDYRQSVLGKFETLRDIAKTDNLTSVFLWVDTDRAGSDNLTTKFAWPSNRKKGPITILPPGTRKLETRFSRIHPEITKNAVEQLWTAMRQSNDAIDGAKGRCEALKLVFSQNSHLSLSDFNLKLADFLLSNVFDYVPESAVLSGLLDQPNVQSDADLFVDQIGDVIKVFNEAIENLIENDINPQVKPLPEQYLPLFYSCDDDHRRLRLFHIVDGVDHYAIGNCRCGREFKFHLGQKHLSIGEIVQTKRWSPDVCFPVLINDMVSGFLAGKSSALYLIVLNAVMRRVLGKNPVPILVPENIEHQPDLHGKFDSLLYQYLAGVKR